LSILAGFRILPPGTLDMPLSGLMPGAHINYALQRALTDRFLFSADAGLGVYFSDGPVSTQTVPGTLSGWMATAEARAGFLWVNDQVAVSLRARAEIGWLSFDGTYDYLGSQRKVQGGVARLGLGLEAGVEFHVNKRLAFMATIGKDAGIAIPYGFVSDWLIFAGTMLKF
jgi:hypothetical protein